MIGKRLNNKCSSDIVIDNVVIPAKSSITITLKEYMELCNDSVLSNCIKNKSIVVYNTNIDNKITTSNNDTTSNNINTTNNPISNNIMSNF